MSHSSPKIALCTTAKNRTQHIRKTLPQNLIDNRSYPDLVHVVLDYGSTDGLREYIATEHVADLASGRLVVYSYPTNGPFRMSHAKNVAHRCGLLESAHILVNLDADNFTGEGFAQYISSQFCNHSPRTFMWSHVVPGMGRQFRGCSGRIAVTGHAFINAGGYDEKYLTYSPDDKDFNIRLQRLGYEPVEIDRRYLRSVPHSDGLRFKEYPHAKMSIEEYENDIHDCVSDTTIANFGHFGEGQVYRNFSDTPIVLGPVPTRIFGIGFHKTATNSLTSALRILGIDAGHWESPAHAMAIWTEMKVDGRSRTLERNYATSDFPIAILYRELARAYPGSKFILTIRNPDKWIASVRNHWDYQHNQYRASWNTDCFTHRLHTEVYGQRTFDETVFMSRYQLHNREVRGYFEDRPDDLLIMDMDGFGGGPDGWPELCNFLGKPIPSTPYPHEYVTL